MNLCVNSFLGPTKISFISFTQGEYRCNHLLSGSLVLILLTNKIRTPDSKPQKNAIKLVKFRKNLD